LIKPNFADVVRDLPRRDGDQTSIEVLEALVKILNEQTSPEHLIMGECSATPTWRAYFEYGMHDLAIKRNIRLVDMNNDDAKLVRLKDGYYIKEVWLPRTLFEADAIISVPVLKVWGASCISLSIKNYTGGILPSYWYRKYRNTQGLCGVINWRNNPQYQPDNLYGQSQTLAAGMTDILLAAPKVTFSVIDGLRCMHLRSSEADFEFKSSNVLSERTNLLVGGQDIVAVDSVGAALMSIDPKKVVHLEFAARKGIGKNDLSKIEVVGTRIEQVRLRVNPPASMKEVLI
jgi:uncharacterized protein (DUF362 family)